MRGIHQSEESSQEEPDFPQDTSGETSSIGLRILATTDIHAQFLGYDYVNDRPGPHAGLAGLATLIESARAEAADEGMACVLLDNGDLLQGTPIGQWLAAQPVDGRHPIVSGLSLLGFDAIGLGNHDLDYGLDYVIDLAANLPIPVISSNLLFVSPGPLHQTALINCRLPGAEPASSALKIGVVSVLPSKTALWNRSALQGIAEMLPISESVSEATATVRAQGADIVVLLAHLGIESATQEDDGQEDARILATVPGVDAMVLGHTHRRLPGSDHAGFENVDVREGRLGVTPTVMPGHAGSDLAVLDLKLRRTEGGDWKVRSHQTTLQQNTSDVAPSPAISALFAPAHIKTRSDLAQPRGWTEEHLQNYFSLAVPTNTCALVASAKHLAVAEEVAGTALSDLPILAAAAAHTAGGRSGPSHYLSIPPGPLFERHLAGLSPYANAIWGLRVTGADLRLWLERSAGVYARLQPDQPTQPLLNQSRPVFDHDTIFGLTYDVDPTRAPGERVVGLRFQERTVQSDDAFLLATDSFRASGGGGGQPFRADQVVCQCDLSLRTALSRTVGLNNPAFPKDSRPWRLVCPPGVSAVLRTAPEALEHLGDISHLSPTLTGTDGDGFASIQLKL